MIIKKVETKEEAIECNKLLTMLIRQEKEYDPNTNENFEVSNWFENLYFKDDYVLYIAIIDKMVVGYIYAKIKELDFTSIKNEEVIIDGLYVLENYRNKGIATCLINKVKDWCINKKIDIISLNVMYNNDVARKLYAKLGFANFSLTLKCKL